MQKMFKQFMLVTAVAAAASVCAQETTIPSMSEMTGDFIVLNSQSYNGVKSLASMKPFTIEPADNDSITLSGFYMRNCLDFKAEYSETTGKISIPAGTPVFDYFGSYLIYLYPWNTEDEEVIMRPIEYKYIGNNVWECNSDLMLVAIQGEEMQMSVFSSGSRIARCNGTTNNTSYVGTADEQDEYIESRPSYVTISGNNIDIYNILQADQYGYGVHLSGTIDRTAGKVWFGYTLTGQANDRNYRILTGCEYDEDTNMPTKVAYSGTNNYGKVRASIDLEKGEIAIDPMAIWVAEYSESGIMVDENQFYEFVKTVNVTYDVSKTDISAIEAPSMTNVEKEVSHIDYYAIDGRKLAEPQEGSLVIKVTVYTDKSTQVEKIVYLKH